MLKSENTLCITEKNDFIHIKNFIRRATEVHRVPNLIHTALKLLNIYY